MVHDFLNLDKQGTFVTKYFDTKFTKESAENKITRRNDQGSGKHY